MESFQAIKEYADEQKEASISHLCRILKVSRSGYYKWLRHQETPSEQENTRLIDVIKALHSQHNGILGYRRMTRFVNRKLETNYNKKRIRRLMHILGIRSIIRRSKGYCTKTSFVNVEDNILNRDFTATAPDQKWCTDVMFLKYGIGCKAYLSAIKDLYDGSIVAYVVGQFNDNELVFETLRKARKANPEATPLIHSDRGSQYTSKDYYRLTTKYQMILLMHHIIRSRKDHHLCIFLYSKYIYMIVCPYIRFFYRPPDPCILRLDFKNRIILTEFKIVKNMICTVFYSQSFCNIPIRIKDFIRSVSQ